MILKANNVVKYYGLNQALKSFSLEVPEKTVFALLGPNGAGKTTFIKVLLGLVRFESGEVEILSSTPGAKDVKREHLTFLNDLTFIVFIRPHKSLLYTGN